MICIEHDPRDIKKTCNQSTNNSVEDIEYIPMDQNQVVYVHSGYGMKIKQWKFLCENARRPYDN